VYDESLPTYNAAQKDPNNTHRLDAIDFGRRVAIERDIDQVWVLCLFAVCECMCVGREGWQARRAWIDHIRREWSLLVVSDVVGHKGNSE
jgi:hypothetical protein